MPQPDPNRQPSLFDGLVRPASPVRAGAAPADRNDPEAGAGSGKGLAATVAASIPLGPETSLAAAITAFQAHLLLDGKTENTRQAFASDLRLLCRYLAPGTAIGALDTDRLNTFLIWMLADREVPCQPKTYARRVTTLKVFFGWLAAIDALPDDPAAPLIHRPAEPPLPLVLTDAEVRRLLASAEFARLTPGGDPRPELVVRLVLDAGLKKGELIRLKVGDLNTDKDPPTLLVRYDLPRWQAKERRVSFGRATVEVLDHYFGRYQLDGLLIGCTARNLEYLLADLVKTAGLPEKTSFETLRWTSALRHLRSGLDADDLRQRLGLSSVTWVVTERKLALLAPGMGESHPTPYF